MPRTRHKPQRIMAKLRQVNVSTSQVKRLKRSIAGAFDRGRLEAVPLLQQENEDHSFTLLSLLWRRSWFIAGFCLIVGIMAALITSLVPNRYTADAIIQVRLATSSPALTSVRANRRDWGIALNAASMIETEVGLISSRSIAERVAARLEHNDTAFLLRKSLIARARDLLVSVWPSSAKLPSRSVESIIADELMSNLTVTNDIRSYLIKISYTSTSPERSARIANAFAVEYLRARNASLARQELVDLVAIYGPKHPNILKAQAQLDKASRSNTSEDAQLLIPAQPIPIPSSPNWLLILGLALAGSLAVGSIVVLIHERAAFRLAGS